MSKLYLVPTPIGNLGDITFRAVEVLNEADLLLAEDTRKSAVLLKHLKISKPVQSHHKFNEHRSVESLVQRLLEGSSMALITDAGTPGISDPGFLLVRACLEHGIEIERTKEGVIADVERDIGAQLDDLGGGVMLGQFGVEGLVDL